MNTPRRSFLQSLLALFGLGAAKAVAKSEPQLACSNYGADYLLIGADVSVMGVEVLALDYGIPETPDVESVKETIGEVTCEVTDSMGAGRHAR